MINSLAIRRECEVEEKCQDFFKINNLN